MDFRSKSVWVSIQDNSNGTVPNFAIFLVIAAAKAVAVVTVLAACKALAVKFQAFGILAVAMLL